MRHGVTISFTISYGENISVFNLGPTATKRTVSLINEDIIEAEYSKYMNLK